ncbi:MAG: OmpH family outer membrane protein [Pseudomonadales bacterium]|nr:OmpH family outer membrane protein [Pseudomonadales bacterium]
MMKKWILAVLFIVPALAMADGRVGVIYPLKALQDTNAVQERMSALEKELSGDENRLKSLSGEVQNIQAKLQKEGMTMSTDEQEQLRTEGQQKMIEIKSLQRKLQNRAGGVEREIMEEMGPKLEAAIAEVAKKQKLDLVLNAQAAVYVGDDTLDITQAVSDQLNK